MDLFVSHIEVVVNIFEEATGGLDLINDSANIRPEVAWIGGPKTLAGNRERLAGIAACDAIHDSTPRLAVEGSDIRVNRCWIHEAVFHRLYQLADEECFPLHQADCASAWNCQLDTEAEASVSGAEFEESEGR